MFQPARVLSSGFAAAGTSEPVSLLPSATTVKVICVVRQIADGATFHVHVEGLVGSTWRQIAVLDAQSSPGVEAVTVPLRGGEVELHESPQLRLAWTVTGSGHVGEALIAVVGG